MKTILLLLLSCCAFAQVPTKCSKIQIIEYSVDEELKSIQDNEGYISIVYLCNSDTIELPYRTPEEIEILIKTGEVVSY